MDSFQFKGMLSKGYWLNKNERLRPVSVNPINVVGGVYEPCSIEEANDTDPDTRLRQKLSQISDETSSDEEDIQVIEHNSQTPSLTENITELSKGQTLVFTKKDNQSDVLSDSYSKNDQNVWLYISFYQSFDLQTIT